MNSEAKAIIVMGVSGSGKSTVGEGIAHQMGWLFYDADDFHPAENVSKMASGTALTDDDRWPWLQALQQLIHDHLSHKKSMVLACSALKQSYRDLLLDQNLRAQIVYLEGSFELILGRMQARENHYMRAEMLQSQFDALEPPQDVLTISIENSIESIIESVSLLLMD